MLSIEPTGQVLGATIHGLDLAKPLGDREFGTLIWALGKYGVLRFPAQKIESLHLRDFSTRFGDIQILARNKTPEEMECPGVGILSNIKVDGRAIGIPDAGQAWHTDMSYNKVIGFVNVLYALQVPHRDGRALGGTEFANMHRAYEDLPDDIKARLKDATVLHNITKFNEQSRARGSTRAAYTDDQKGKNPPASHPIFLTHPITGKKVLYCNPGFAVSIDGWPADESETMLERLFEHQLQKKYRYLFTWTVGDVLMWDHVGTLHQAIPDYRPDEHRLMKRCQVMGTRIFDPTFTGPALRASGQVA